jgi:hypothetical protein
MNFTRREWTYLATAALCGCKERKSTPAASTPAIADRCPFIVEIPPAWVASSHIEKVPAKPVYTPEELAGVPNDEQNGIPPAIHKPGYFNRPQHWAIRLPAATPDGIPINLEDPGDDPTAAQILIHKADEWASILTDGQVGRQKSREFLGSLRQMTMDELSGKETDFHPASVDGHLGFRALKRRLDFDGGYGIRMLAQRNIEPDLIHKGRLHYLFLGLSDDDSCQIIATFPVNIAGLPEDESKAGHLGRILDHYEDFVADFESYERDAVAWLGQHAGEITPSLDVLDNLIRSLVVRRWE